MRGWAQSVTTESLPSVRHNDPVRIRAGWSAPSYSSQFGLTIAAISRPQISKRCRSGNSLYGVSAAGGLAGPSWLVSLLCGSSHHDARPGTRTMGTTQADAAMLGGGQRPKKRSRFRVVSLL